MSLMFFCFQMYVFIFHSPKWHPFHHCLQPRDVPSKTHEASRKNVSYGPRKASTFGRRRRQPGAHWVGGSWWKLIEGPKSWLSHCKCKENSWMNPQKDDGEGFPLDYFSPHANSGWCFNDEESMNSVHTAASCIVLLVSPSEVYCRCSVWYWFRASAIF